MMAGNLGVHLAVRMVATLEQAKVVPKALFSVVNWVGLMESFELKGVWSDKMRGSSTDF
jgi:hypothetical protein